MKITILTLFPDYFARPLAESMIGRAATTQKCQFQIINIRDFAPGKHRVTDDRPYGGGPGMVMKLEPIFNALASLDLTNDHGLKPLEDRSEKIRVVLTSAKGEIFTQQVAESYSQLDHLVMVCGHYEGVDERVATHLVDAEIRIGDYVLTGGEPAALVMTDAVVRLLPGVLGNEFSTQNESHSEPGLLGYGQYTRPEEFMGWTVPPVLLGGNHAEIKAWRKQNQANLNQDTDA